VKIGFKINIPMMMMMMMMMIVMMTIMSDLNDLKLYQLLLAGEHRYLDIPNLAGNGHIQLYVADLPAVDGG